MNILLAGVGGQGTVLASRLIAQCGLDKNEPAHTAETIGMAQRGGSVVSHVRLGAHVYAPLIPKGTAELLLGFEPAEAVRCFDYLKPGGSVIVSNRPIRPTTSILSGGTYQSDEMIAFLRANAGFTVVVDGDALKRANISHRALNIALLGAACQSGVLPFTEADIVLAMKKLMAPKHLDDNLRALKFGAECVTTR